MFKKGPDIDKKKLLSKALDVKKDSLTRLKHFKTLIEHLDHNEIPLLFKSNFSFIYHTFIDTFSIFDGNSKQRREDLDCILFILEKILVYNPELIKKRWQFFSITFVMQKLLHQNNTWRLRQEGVRLFVLWYQILGDETNRELQTMFASIVPGVVPQSQIPASSPQQQHANNKLVQEHQQPPYNTSPNQPQLPVKLCSIDPLVARSTNELLPNDETSYYLDSLLQFMVTEITRPYWEIPEDSHRNQELSFAFMFNMFKQIYLKNLFPNFDTNFLPNPSTKLYLSSHSINQYVDDVGDVSQTNRGISQQNDQQDSNQGTSQRPRRDPLNIDLKGSNQQLRSNMNREPSIEQSQTIALSVYQSIVIRWLTRIMRQDTIPGQDELIKANSGERQEAALLYKGNSSSQNEQEYSHHSDPNSGTIFQNVESTSCEMEIARKVTGTYPENIAVIHELFRRAFLNYFQPASMKRVVNVYKEWICNGGPTQGGSSQTRSKLGYTSFGDLLQIFVLNSSNAFVTKLHNPGMLDEQVEMCKRIMNIYRFMVMKIYMNTGTWEQLLNVMLSITEHLFPANPPERKESTIGGRIAPAFFQTFIVSWIRANLYVHISNRMWDEFHRVMKNLIKWRELIEEWSTTMGSLTRVLVKHVYNLNLTDLPLEKPPDRRRRTRAMKSLSTCAAATSPTKTNHSPTSVGATRATRANPPISNRSDSVRLPEIRERESNSRGLTRSNSDGMIFQVNTKLYYSSMGPSSRIGEDRLRRIRSEHILIDRVIDNVAGGRSSSPSNTDAIDGSSLKDPNMIIDHDHVIENQPSNSKTTRQDYKDKCVLLGGSLRGWTSENSVIMWRRMLGLFGNINCIEDPENHLVAMRCLAVMLCDFIKTRENLGISADNQSTPEKPNLIPPYNFYVGWLLEATNLPQQFQKSRITAYKLLCLMSIRRHDIELPQQYYAAIYEALHRGLTSSDTQIHASIIKNCAQILSLELPGCTFLVQDLFERSRTLLLHSPQELGLQLSPRDRAVEILSAILNLNRHIKKLMVLKPEINNPMNLVTPGDIKTKVFETFLACNTSSIVLDHQTKSRSLCAMAIQVYQELCDNSNSLDVEKLFDVLMTHLQDSSRGDFFRVICDLLKLFSDHAQTLSHSRPALVSALIQTLCQLVVRLSTNEDCKDAVNCLLVCLEDWCLAVEKNYLMKPVCQLTSEDGTEELSNSLNESLLTIVLRSLENVINEEQYVDDSYTRGARGSVVSTSKGSDVASHQSQQGSNSDQSGTGGTNRDRTITNDGSPSSNQRSAEENKNLVSMKLACKVSHNKILTYLGHFPFRQVGAATMSCLISESDYLSGSGHQELTDLKNSPAICLLVINESTIITFLSLTATSNSQQRPIEAAHMIIRNICGKYSWDANCIDLTTGLRPYPEMDIIQIDPESFLNDYSRASMKFDPDFNDEGNSSSSLSSRSSLSRDYISDLLNQLSSIMTNSSANSASGQNIYKKRNSAHSVSNPRLKIAQSEESMIALLTNQRFQELNFCDRSDNVDMVSINIGNKLTSPYFFKQSGDDVSDIRNSGRQRFCPEQCRQFIQQLGYLSWEKRCKIDSLSKNARLLRELKNLDSQPSRETHKIAVIYVANEQEDKNSILSNASGSRAFEDFTLSLGWEVNLASHLGFKGGLQANKSTGETSVYYCNGTTEVMYHVSTRIPIAEPLDDESLNKKLRHLGNDEIHIVWSEHHRDYRRGIIPTEFGDAIIAIYPMLTFCGYYRIHIMSKPDVPLFGPLFDNCVVHQTSLAALVRATAINASRAKRSKLPYYQSHSEERHRLITTIVQNHKEKLSFEDFAVQLYRSSSVIGTDSVTDQVIATGGNQGACCS